MKQPKISESSKQILMHISEGLTNKEIADKLEMNKRTVEDRIARLLKKFECKNRTQLSLKIVLYNIGGVLSKV
jgi:two-component system nitrate/nitrite response regulator NarL